MAKQKKFRKAASGLPVDWDDFKVVIDSMKALRDQKDELFTRLRQQPNESSIHKLDLYCRRLLDKIATLNTLDRKKVFAARQRSANAQYVQKLTGNSPSRDRRMEGTSIQRAQGQTKKPGSHSENKHHSA